MLAFISTRLGKFHVMLPPLRSTLIAPLVHPAGRRRLLAQQNPDPKLWDWTHLFGSKCYHISL